MNSFSVSLGNPSYKSDSGLLLTKNGKTLVSVLPINSANVIIPGSVTRIGDYAFYGCSGITSVTIPDSVMSIGDYAFHGCSGLTSVTIPNSVTSIGDYAFWFCRGLTSVTIGNGVTSIGDSAFWLCRGLTSVTIPNSVTSIGSSAFADCSGLTSVTMPDSVTSIGSSAFAGCSGLTSVTIPDSVTSIGPYAFSSCSGLTSVTIPDGVTSIGPYAFRGCRGLMSVTIPDSVTSIGDYAFSSCSGLTSVRLPKRFWKVVGTVFEACPDDMVIDYYDPPYTINFHRNDASNGKEEAYDFDYGVRTRLPSLNKLGWARRGFNFLGWAASAGNAARGTIWAADWGIVSTAAPVGKTLDVYASWALKDGFYAIQFIRNDGAGTWRTVGFPYGEKTRMPTLANGLGWGRRGYQFNGWAQTAANANNGVIWKGDWGYVATPVAAGSTLMVYASWTLKPGYYQIRFNKNDGSGKWRTLGFECGASAKLNTIAGLGWEIPGKTFKGWASNKANADAGKVWKTDGAWLKDATAEGKTLSIYAVWE